MQESVERMQSIRSWIGMAPAGGAGGGNSKPNATLARRQQAAQEKPHAERLASLVKAQTLQISQLQEDVDDLNANISRAVAAGDRRTAGAHLEERKRIQADMDVRRKKLANTRAQQKALETANSNIEHGLLLQEGASELKSAVQAMETIDLHEAVNDIQEAASMVDEHNAMLTEPILGSGGGTSLLDDAEMDAELDALMNAGHVDLPSVPSAKPTVAASVKKPSALISAEIKTDKE